MPHYINFTKRTIAALPPAAKGKRAYHYDKKIPGLCVGVTHTGNKSYYLYRKIQRRAERIFLGKALDLTPEQARNKASRLNGEIAQGMNPQEAKRAQRGELTLKDLFQELEERHLLYRKEKTVSEYKRQFQTYLERWHNRSLSSVTRRDVQSLHGRIGKKHGHYIANRVLALLKLLFNKGKAWGHIAGENPATGVVRYKEHSRERFLERDEVRRFMIALEEEPNGTIRDCLYLCLVTGARRSNVQSMRWEDLDLDKGLWRIPDTKSGDSPTLVLAMTAVDTLRGRAGTGSEWVFPGSGKTGHLVESKTAWKRICKRAGLVDLRIHDLRRTFGSWQAITGASLPMIGKTLNHKTASATQVYARFSEDPQREAIEKALYAMFNTYVEKKEQNTSNQRLVVLDLEGEGGIKKENISK